MNKIILIGGGGHCKSVIDVIEQEDKFKISGIIDQPKLLGSKVLGYDIIGSDNDLIKLANKFTYAFITLGQIKSAVKRIKLFNLAKIVGFKFPTIISPRAYVSKHSSIGEGTVIMHNAIINANASIGDNCIINTNALIEHDCKISSHCHISTNATINGSVQVKSKCFIGSNSVTKDGIKIKGSSFIKANSLVK
jgi:sugar O-acyltransferase (sialic acid O-acetyltransferase NeuD family)